jgi:cyclin B
VDFASRDSSPEKLPVAKQLDEQADATPSPFTYDEEQKMDPSQIPDYAFDIFQYYRSREAQFKVGDYLPKQKDLSKQMRAILVDWMVEVQENFELNHETLYQGVKITDLYLDRVHVPRERLQLVGSTALFIACKFDERNPPLLDDFLYICDDAYSRDELMDMERQILITLDFDIGMPLSYRFVRRFAKATKAAMETLTLARYILETSLMHYDLMLESESLLAAGAFFLAIRMRDNGEWTPDHVHYSGYELADIIEMTKALNRMLRSAPPAKNVTTIKNKYSHQVFFEVAKIPLIEDNKLLF